MQKTFHTYVKNYTVVLPERLYGEYRSFTENAFTTKAASLYFVAKCAAAEWLPDTFVVGDDYCLKGRLRVDGKEVDVSLDMAALWFALPQLQEEFRTKAEMAEYFMNRSKVNAGGNSTGALKYKKGTSVSLSASDTAQLVVECELCRNMNKEGRATTEIYVYQAINFFKLPAPKLEIIYIGSSITNTFERLYGHEKWGRMQAEKKRNEDILVFFAELEGDAYQRQSLNGVSTIERHAHKISADDETLISEMALINYFKPFYNVHYKDVDISNKESVERALKTAGFHEIAVEVILDDSIGALGTEHVQTYGSHMALHKIA